VYKTLGKFCKNKYCQTHGHHVRKRRAEARYHYDYQNSDTYSCTLPVDAYIGYYQYTLVRRSFVAGFRAVFGNAPFWYETEYVWTRPHIHFVFRLPLGSDPATVERHIRQIWREALEAGGIPYTGQRVGIKVVGKTRRDVRKLTDYIFKTNRGSMPVKNCGPVGWTYTSQIYRWVEDCDCKEPDDDKTTDQIINEITTRLGIGCKADDKGDDGDCVRHGGLGVKSRVGSRGDGRGNIPNRRTLLGRLRSLFKFAWTIFDTS